MYEYVAMFATPAKHPELESSDASVETPDLAQGGECPGPDTSDGDGANAAEDDSRCGADEGGHGAGAELAEFVGGADKDAVDRIDAATDVVGRPQLDQRLADVDADHIGGADEGEAH